MKAFLRWIVPDTVRRSYALKFVVTFVLLGALFGGTGLLVTQAFAEDVRANADRQLAEIASQETQQTQSWLQRHFDNARFVATDEQLATDDSDTVSNYLDSQITLLPPSVLRIHYIDTAERRVIGSTNEEFEGTSFSSIDEAWVASVPFDGTRHVSAPYTGLGVTRVAFAQRLEDQQERAIVIEVETRGGATTLDDNEGGPGVGYTEIVTSTGRVVFGERPSRAGEPYASNGSQDALERAFQAETPGTVASEGNVFISRELAAESYLVSHAKVDGADWAVLVHAPQNDVYGFAQQVTFFGLVGTGIGLLFIGLLGVGLGKHTSIAIDRLVEKAKQMEQGDLTVEFNNKRIDNIGRLYQEFDRAQDAIREHIEQAVLVEHSYDLITVLDANGTVIYQSPSSEHIIGVDPVEIEGKNFLDKLHVDDRGAAETAVEQALNHPDDEQCFEFRTRNAAGNWRNFQAVCENHRENPFVEGLIVSSRDVSELKQREQELRETKRDLEQSNEKLEQFAGVISHDLRNPLNVALGRLEIVREEAPDEQVEKIGRSLRRMEAMIDDLLAMARAGKTVEETQPVALAAVATDAWDHVQTSGGDLEIQVPADVSVEGDRDRLLQIFENLFRNAFDHNGSPLQMRVGVLDGSDESPRTLTGFYIEDDGCGIPPEKRSEVFDHGYTSSEEGSGFGLSIVQDAVTAHGWTIDLCEGEDGGARFEVAGITE